MEQENLYCVYVHENTINGKRYVGITKRNVEERWMKGNGYHRNKHFYRAINQYGWDNFNHTIVASKLSKEEACELERKLIKEYNTTNPQFGYNNTEGGEGVSGYRHTEETKRRISEKMSGDNNPNYMGVNNTPEQMKQLRLANLGSHHSEEHKRKIGEALRGQHYHSDEFKQQLSQRSSKPIMQDDGTIFPSVASAAQFYGVNHSAIIQSMKRHTKSCGHYWKYVE